VKYDVKYQVHNEWRIFIVIGDDILAIIPTLSNIPFLLFSQASAQPFLVLGLLVTALATSH